MANPPQGCVETCHGLRWINISGVASAMVPNTTIVFTAMERIDASRRGFGQLADHRSKDRPFKTDGTDRTERESCVPSRDAAWRSVQPSEGLHWLSALSVPWWVAGGWALDLFVGRQSRPHKDFDVGIRRRDIREVTARLPAWEFFEAKDGVLTPLDGGGVPRTDVNSLWGRRMGFASFEMELMLDEADETDWVFRRTAMIRRPLATAIRFNPDGVPYLSPEIQLLYKARAARAQDDADFAYIAPRLDLAARGWLQKALAVVEPGHAWLSVLTGISPHATSDMR